MATHFTGPLLNRELDRGNRQWFSKLPITPGPDYAVYFNDFLVAQDYAAADWVITTTEVGAGSATEALAADERSGALLLTNAAGDNDLDSLQHTEETWSLSAGKRLWFETRVKINDVDQVDNFLGLCITDTTPLDATDRVGFLLVDGSPSINVLCEKNTTETLVDTGEDAADDTYVTLGLAWDGKNKVEAFVNRQLKATITTNIPDDENLCVTLHHQNGEATAQTMHVDYVYVCQER